MHSSKFLTIAILSFNKARYTLDLLDSINRFEPDADFKILILDQGSASSQIQKLKRGVSDSRVQIMENSFNLGVGGGRQVLLSHAATEYVLFLDNDLVFQSQFYERVVDVCQYSDFACMPFVEVGNNEISEVIIPELFVTPVIERKFNYAFGVGSSTANFKSITYPHPISGIAGGVFLAKTETLKVQGGFRGPGKVGYEDLELALRLKNNGHAVYLVPLSQPLVHNKRVSNDSIGTNTESSRLDPLELRANARFVEHEHKGHVWGSLQYDWLANRFVTQGNTEYGISALTNHRTGSKLIDKRPQILLVCDSPGWAFDRIARQIKRRLGSTFSICITYSNDWESLKAHLFSDDWGAVLFLWRVPLYQLVREGLIDESMMQRISYCVYDFQGAMGYKDAASYLEEKGVPIGVVNKKLYENYSLLHRNIFYIPDGVDRGIFFPQKYRRNSGALVLGWSGNTNWGGEDDVKGFSRILRPAIEHFAYMSDKVEFEIIDSSKGRIPHSEVAMMMRDWDVVLCSSRHEGTPNPVIEGLATGLSVISTKVGMTEELVSAGARIRFIENTPESMISAISQVFEDHSSGKLLEERRQNRLSTIEFDWSRVLNYHLKLLNFVLERSKR